MEEQLRAAVYQYLVANGEKKAAKALRKAHADADLDAQVTSLEDLWKAHNPMKATKAAKAAEPAPAPAAEQDDGEMPKKDKKKRKRAAEEEAPAQEEQKEQNEEAVAQAAKADDSSATKPEKDRANGSEKKSKKKQQERFQRVNPDEVEFLDPRLVDYSHESKGDDDWGRKANQILSAVRGKDFRHEKTKKKRGTYKGGHITTQVNSIKFDD